MPVENYEDDEEEQEGPRSSFATYLAEGDTLFKQSEFKKALESYSLALELQPNDKICLVARSKCYLKLGDPQKALMDAEAALSEDKEFNKGLYRKAEALYCMGDFEYALMYYHRGHKLRPELDEFRLGIQKAQEAIDNSIGSAAKIKLENKGDLTFFMKQDDIGSKKRGGYGKPTRTNIKLKPTIANRNKEIKPPAPSKKTVKQLLGELYSDKEYLEKLMEDADFIKSQENQPIYELVQGGIDYLDTRTEFWRQQKPLYARKKDKEKRPGERKKKKKPSVAKYVLKQLEEVDQALMNGDPERSLKVAQNLLKVVEESSLRDLPNKSEVIGNVHSCIGNAFVEMEHLNKALKHHQKDLDISKKSESKDGISRALDNIGRVFARMGKYDKAVKSWTEKLPLVKTPLESTWLSHEIGRCYLELGKYSKAKEYGEKSLAAGEECGDEVWQLNANVLIAQSQVKLDDLRGAVDTFNAAYEIAVTLEDAAAQIAITKALEDVQRKLGEDNNTSGNAETTSQDEHSDNESESGHISTDEAVKTTGVDTTTIDNENNNDENLNNNKESTDEISPRDSLENDKTEEEYTQEEFEYKNNEDNTPEKEKMNDEKESDKESDEKEEEKGFFSKLVDKVEDAIEGSDHESEKSEEEKSDEKKNIDDIGNNDDKEFEEKENIQKVDDTKKEEFHDSISQNGSEKSKEGEERKENSFSEYVKEEESKSVIRDAEEEGKKTEEENFIDAKDRKVSQENIDNDGEIGNKKTVSVDKHEDDSFDKRISEPEENESNLGIDSSDKEDQNEKEESNETEKKELKPDVDSVDKVDQSENKETKESEKNQLKPDVDSDHKVDQSENKEMSNELRTAEEENKSTYNESKITEENEPENNELKTTEEDITIERRQLKSEDDKLEVIQKELSENNGTIKNEEENDNIIDKVDNSKEKHNNAESNVDDKEKNVSDENEKIDNDDFYD